MYFRKLLQITFVVCVLSIFLWQNMSHAYPSGKSWDTAERDLKTAKDALKPWETQLAEVRDAVETLNGEWGTTRMKSNRDKI